LSVAENELLRVKRLETFETDGNDIRTGRQLAKLESPSSIGEHRTQSRVSHAGQGNWCADNGRAAAIFHNAGDVGGTLGGGRFLALTIPISLLYLLIAPWKTLGRVYFGRKARTLRKLVAAPNL